MTVLSAVRRAEGDHAAHLQDAVRDALTRGYPLDIHGGDSKRDIGRAVSGERLDTREHSGIVAFDPCELVVRARCGTPLAEVTAVLAEHGQMLGCEPPDYNGCATVGGMVAAGLSGPRRPWVGAVRDFVLGARLINGRGEHLRFGGDVMKNVAGYDVSRLLCASFGTLGVITEVALKVLPTPRAHRGVALQLDAQTAAERLIHWQREGLPISGATHDGSVLRLRLEGGETSVGDAQRRLGGDELQVDYWYDLNQQRLPFFAGTGALWRIALPNATPPQTWPGATLSDWAGAQIWLKSDAEAGEIRRQAVRWGGHAHCHAPGREQPFQPLRPELLRYHQRLKAQLDPQGIFNPGRLYADL